MNKREIMRRLREQFALQCVPRLHLFMASEQNVVRDQGRKRIKTSAEAMEVFRPFFIPFIDHREAAYVLLLDRGCGCLGVVEVSVGGLHGTVVDPKIIFGAALMAQACTIILCHNHPSGQCRPSHEDIMLTKELVAAGRALGICFQDHIILTSESYYSFADNGQLI